MTDRRDRTGDGEAGGEPPAAPDTGAGGPELTEREGARAVAEAAEEAATPPPARGEPASPSGRPEDEPPAAATVDPQAAVERPAPAADAASATPDRAEPGGLVEERPELLVAGAFAGGLVLALVLKRIGRG